MSDECLSSGQRLAAQIKARPDLDETTIARLIDTAIEQAVRQSSTQGANVCGIGAHRIVAVFCAVSGCGSPRSGRSLYCKMHDMRYRRHGDPQIVLKPWGKKV